MPIERALPIPCPLRRWRGILTYLRALLTLPVGLQARHSTEEWCFGNAPDDPEDAEVLREVQDAATGDADIHVLLLTPFGIRSSPTPTRRWAPAVFSSDGSSSISSAARKQRAWQVADA